MKTLIERMEELANFGQTQEHYKTIQEAIAALREQEAEIDILSNNLEAEELCRAEITDFVTEELEPQIAELQARIEELEETNRNLNITNRDQWVHNKRLDAALARYEQYFVGRSHACSGRDCVGFWQEPTGSLSRCNECTEVIELGKARAEEMKTLTEQLEPWVEQLQRVQNFHQAINSTGKVELLDLLKESITALRELEACKRINATLLFSNAALLEMTDMDKALNKNLQARIEELEREKFQLDHDAEKWASRYDRAALEIKRLDAALDRVGQLIMDGYSGAYLLEELEKARAGE